MELIWIYCPRYAGVGRYEGAGGIAFKALINVTLIMSITELLRTIRGNVRFF